MGRGSFGLFKPAWEITADRVTLTRNVWLPYLLLLVGIVGGVAFADAVGRHHHGALMWPGFAGMMCGLFALVMTPWLAPAKIEATRDGLVWGWRKLGHVPVHARVTVVKARGVYQSWMLTSMDGKTPVLLDLGNRSGFATSTELQMVADAMNALLKR